MFKSWNALLITLFFALNLTGCEDETPAPEPPSDPKTADEEAKPPAEEKPQAEADPNVKPGEENIEPAQRKIHEFGRELLATRKRFYRDLKVLVKNPKMPPEVLKEEVRDLYDIYESRFVDHGRKIQSLEGDARGVILKVDNYITAEPLGMTIWVEQEANRIVKFNPDLADLLLKSYSLPRCYDFALLRKNDPRRAKRLGLMEEE